MNSVPPEVLYALIFAAIVLVQYLMKRFGGQPQPAGAPQEGPIPEEQAPEQEAPVPSHRGPVPEVAAVSLAAAAWAARLEPPTAGAAIARRRSAARSLLGGGQDLRRAVIGMTLLGPCRAKEPPENR
jgi:hypothetical protein